MPKKKFDTPKLLTVSADAADLALLNQIATLKGKNKSALVVQWIHREARAAGLLPKTAAGRKRQAD
jgi:hypothetical protein